jgi:hypothetical protein
VQKAGYIRTIIVHKLPFANRNRDITTADAKIKRFLLLRNGNCSGATQRFLPGKSLTNDCPQGSLPMSAFLPIINESNMRDAILKD